MSGTQEFLFDLSDTGGVDYTDESTNIDARTLDEMRELMAAYPQPRSALIPMLHLVQSVDGRVSSVGVRVCAELLGISAAAVVGVATFYTMFKRKAAGQHHIGVCRTALCAVMGGDILMERVSEKLGIKDGETSPDGKFSLEAIECNAACDFAPVMMVNWEFFDNMTPDKVEKLLDDLRVGNRVQSPRGAQLTSWREAERVIAGFSDGRADEGPGAGEASLAGVQAARVNNWRAPDAKSMTGAAQ